MGMHQRTWLSLISFPLVAVFTYPMVVKPADPPKSVVKGTQDPLAGLSDIQDVLALVRDNYVDPPDLDKVIGGGIQGALERVHPLNAYLSPEDLRLGPAGPADPGITLIKRGIYAQIIAVQPGSPADQAELKPGDIIRKIDGQGIAPMSAWLLERKLKGAEGSSITLLRYASSNAELKTVSLKRELPKPLSIKVCKSEKAHHLILPDLEMGRALELKQLLSGLEPTLPVVLDLRRCMGGNLKEVALMAGFLIGPSAPLVTLQEPQKADHVLLTEGEKDFSHARLVLVTGHGTLGVPEVLCASLKKKGVAVVGDTTGGLGVERKRVLLKQGGAVELVYRRFLGPDGEKLDRQGVVPSYLLKGLKFEEDILTKVLDILEKPPLKKAEKQTLNARLNMNASDVIA